MITVEIRHLHHHADHWFVRGLEARLRSARLVQQDGDAVVFPWPGDDLDPVIAALREGKHVLVEANAIGWSTPLHRLIDAVTPSRIFALINSDRYLPSRQLIRQQLDAGKIGRPGLIRVYHPRVGDISTRMLSALDQILWYFGELPTVAFAHRIGREHDQIHLGFEGGGMAMATFAGFSMHSSLSLIGSSGAAYADEQMNKQVLNQGGSPRLVQMGDTGTQWAGVVQYFVDAIAEKRDLSSSIDSWRQVMVLSEAIERSIALGQAVELEGGPFHG
ncbi:MAG: hypothetical protein EXS16_15420 [Gemmataceae bacterium]|nr:hypothetical protein [Gemmataceae bacterium]